MGRAFQHAGARSVLMTLWPVAEDSTTLLTERFYKHLSDDRNPPDALAAARVDVRASGFEHPFHWGGFVLVGD